MEKIVYQVRKAKLEFSPKRTILNYPPHFHDSVELVYLLEGSTTALVGTKEYELVPGDLLVIFPLQVHAFRNDQEDLRSILMIYSPNIVPMFRNLLCTCTPTSPVLHNADQWPELMETLQLISRYRRDDAPFQEEILYAYLAAFNGHMLRRFTLEPVAEKALGTIHTILRYCSAHYREPLTITHIAEALQLNRNYVSSVFSQRLHISFTDYLNSMRVHDARYLLCTTQNTVTEIAATVGFETTRTFNRAFQRVCGMPPTDYREQMRENHEKCEIVSVSR